MTGQVLLKLPLSAVGGHFWFKMLDKTDLLTPPPCRYAIQMSIKGYNENEFRIALSPGEGISGGEFSWDRLEGCISTAYNIQGGSSRSEPHI